MTQSQKIRVAVLFGGRSAEHEVSLRSAANVIQFLDPTRFEVVPVGIDKQGNWFLGNDIFTKSLAQNTVPRLSQDGQTWFTAEWIGKPTQKENVNQIQKNSTLFDVIFPVLHGTLCEDGTLQGLLELANLPYVGCGVLASAIGMDKDISKRLAMAANIPVAPYITISSRAKWQNKTAEWQKKIIQELGFPVFVKPANTGSSIGISRVKSVEQLAAAIDEAFSFDTKVLVEKALQIRELEVAVLESLQSDAEPIVSVVGEIKPNTRHEFYSYESKYLDENGAELIIPAILDDELAQHVKNVAKKLFKVLECEGMARIDLFLDTQTKEIYFNEINTIPGFTQISMYPKLMSASGISYTHLLTHLIELAIKRHQCKSQLRRNFAIESAQPV